MRNHGGVDDAGMSSPVLEFDSGPSRGRALEDATSTGTVACCGSQRRTIQPRTKADLQQAQLEEARERWRNAALTGLCLAAWILGLVLDKSHLASQSVVIGVYLVAYLAGGIPTLIRALRELREGSVNVDLLMLLAACGAAIVQEWPEGAFLLFLFSLSSTLEQFVLGRTRRAIEALLDLSPEVANVRRDGKEVRLPVEELQIGDTLIVRPAERIAADGVICAGRTSIDQSAMTGESIPVERGVRDPVFAGTLNQQGAIEVRVTKLASDSALSRIVSMVEEAQSARAQSQRFTDWFGARYTLAVLAASALTAIVPILFLGESFAQAFYRAMTVLVVGSPCAVVISIPAAILTAITSAARGGVLFKGGAHLERAAEVRAIAFDKTGTLTLGRPRLVDLVPGPGIAPDQLLQLAASVENLSEHPLARAVVEAAQERGLELRPATHLEALVGRGVTAHVDGQPVWVGKATLLTSRGVALPEAIDEAGRRFAGEGKTTLYVGTADRVLGILTVADTLRPSAEAAITELHHLGIAHQVLITGDNRIVAAAIASRLGLTFEAELLPEDKLRAIHDLAAKYGIVAMVGDGINDAPSLAAANLGVSLAGTGTDVALETADIVLMADDLRQLPYAIALARQARRIIHQNLAFALGVMAVLLLITYFGSLAMPFAVLGHEGSTVLVILNGLRLLAFPRPKLHAAPAG